MPAMDSVPPRSSAAMAGSTRSPTGANKMAASSGSGGAAAGQRDLHGQGGAAPEAIDAEASAVGEFGPLERAVSDDARAQQGRQLIVGVAVGEPVRVGGGDGQVLGVATVGVPAGVAGVRAQVFRVAPAELARLVGGAQPGGTGPVADGEGPWRGAVGAGDLGCFGALA